MALIQLRLPLMLLLLVTMQLLLVFTPVQQLKALWHLAPLLMLAV
ncbi:hypothetical protein [Synechococcus sp. UW140]